MGNDTQLPRFQVFLQEKEGQPHQDVGSVHAPDEEMALYNARDVFVRRPECASLWVVPAAEIYARTAQELDRERPVEGDGRIDQPGKPETYCVFSKTRPAGTQTFRGEVQAASPVEAMHEGISRFGGEQSAFAWWVFPARRITLSQPQDVESLFSPAFDKTFRLSTDFHTMTAMREIKNRSSQHL